MNTNLLKHLKRLFSVQHVTKQSKPKHLICFKYWTTNMVTDILESALSLKRSLKDTHGKKLKVLDNRKIMILQEVNEPFLNMAVSKAATLLGGHDVNITDHLLWETDYVGRIFSYMADVIFVSTKTHMCLQRFSEQSTVPVLCMRSRTHATIQSLATVMAIIEEFKTLKDLNVAYFGAPHPILNSYLLLCPMLGVNLKFKCSCNQSPVSPLLFKASENMCSQTHTDIEECTSKCDVLKDAKVIIAGPTNKKKVDTFQLNENDIHKNSNDKWIFFHTGPRGKEVDDTLFLHNNSKTFVAFENFQYIAAALMANAIKNHKF